MAHRSSFNLCKVVDRLARRGASRLHPGVARLEQEILDEATDVRVTDSRPAWVPTT